MDVRILGPLEVWLDGARVDLGAGRRRALLAILVLNRRRVVSSDGLVAELWGESPPPTAAKGLQNLVAQLRKALAARDGVIETRAAGYVLDLADEEVDAGRFEGAAAEGRRLVGESPAVAARLLGEALDLWRGDVLADFAYEQFAQGEIARLEELRLGALEERIEADLALGETTSLLPGLHRLVAEHPTRERLRAHLMLALYRSGRQAEALEVYAQGRRALRDELGLEPGAELKRLERAILTHDPALGGARALPAVIRTRRRRRLAVGVVAVALLALVAAAVAAVRPSDAVDVFPNSLVVIDADTTDVVDVVQVGRDPGQLAVVGEYVFVAGQEDGTLWRVHGETGETTTSGRHDLTGSIASAGDRSLWATSVTRREVVWIDAESLVRIDGVPLPRDPNILQAWVEVGGDSVWVSEWFPPSLSRWRLRTLERARRIGFVDAEYPLEVAFGHGAAWASLWSTNVLLRVDAGDGKTTEIEVGNGPRDPAVGFGAVWIAMAEDGTVWRIDAESHRMEAIVSVGMHPWGVAIGDDAVWVSSNCDGTVSKIDPETNEVVATVETGFFPQWLAVAGEHVWVGVADTWSPVPGSGPSTLESCN